MSSQKIAENSKDVFTDGNQLFNKFKRTYQIVNNMRFGGVHSGAATSDQWHTWLLSGCRFIPSVLVASPMRNVWRSTRCSCSFRKRLRPFSFHLQVSPPLSSSNDVELLE